MEDNKTNNKLNVLASLGLYINFVIRINCQSILLMSMVCSERESNNYEAEKFARKRMFLDKLNT